MGDGKAWKGDWLPEAFYKVNDVVKYRGIIYVCIDSHTSASTLTLGLENDEAKWSPFAKGTNYLALWTASTIYKKNDLVKVLGRGSINSPVKVEAHKFSKSAVEAIEKAGGETKVI